MVRDSEHNKPPLGRDSDADTSSDNSEDITAAPAPSSNLNDSVQSSDDFSFDIVDETEEFPSTEMHHADENLLRDIEFNAINQLSHLPTRPFHGQGIELSREYSAQKDTFTEDLSTHRRITMNSEEPASPSKSLRHRVGYMLNSTLALGGLFLIVLGLIAQITGGRIHYQASTISEFKEQLLTKGLDHISHQGVSILSARLALYPLIREDDETQFALVVFGEVENSRHTPSPPLALKLRLFSDSSQTIEETIPLGFSLESLELNAQTKQADYEKKVSYFQQEPQAGQIQAKMKIPFGFVLFDPPKNSEQWTYDISLEPLPPVSPRLQDPTLVPPRFNKRNQ